MRKVNRPVNRVEVPAVIIAAVAVTALFGDDGVIGKTAEDALHQQGFGLVIGFGDNIGAAFKADGVITAKTLAQQSTRLARPLNQIIQFWLHGLLHYGVSD